MVESTVQEIRPTTPPVGDLPPEQKVAQRPGQAESQSLVETELLVEDVSIDGMCGVY